MKGKNIMLKFRNFFGKNTKPETAVIAANGSNIFDMLYGYQKEAVNTTFTNDKGIVCLPTGTGKCLKRGTEVLMYNGTIKKVEDIIVGDKIMGDDGKARTILSLANGNEMMYDVIPTKGEPYTVNESHILSLKLTNFGSGNITILDKKYVSGDIIDIPILDYLSTSKFAKHCLKGFRVPIDFEEQDDLLPIDPKLLGLWLADGTAISPSFTINNEDVEIIEYLEKQCNEFNLNFNDSYNSKGSKQYYFSTKLKGRAMKNSNAFLNSLRDNNLINNKHIPQEFKVSSRKNRLELLAGILDGDGSLDNNVFELTLVNEKLMDDVIFIARSLGFSCYKNHKKGVIKSINFEGDYFRTCISGNVDIIPTILKRKKATVRKQKKDVLVTGIEVKPVGVGEYFGFEIDGNRRFVLGDFTVTHNTFCQATIIADDILKKNNGFSMYVVNAPRILLTYQLLKEVYGFLTKYNIEARYMFVHSGGGVDIRDLEELRLNANATGSNIPFSQINSATNSAAIAEQIQQAQRQNLPLIMFSTYDSAEHIETARIISNTLTNISIVLNDEAHYLIQERFHDILNTLIFDRCYFFTATRKHTPSDEGRGMNNENSYGKLLYEMTPREAIQMGKMVRPRIHIVDTVEEYNNEDFERNLSRTIKESYEQHCAVLGKLNGKMLVTVKGTQDIKDFIDSVEYAELREDGVDIYAVAANAEIGNDINGDKVNRSEFLNQLKRNGMKDNKRMIILHYDILAEGIDVSGFTGVLPLRTLGKSKFLQTFGRCARVHPDDRKRIDAGEITPDDLDKMKKPYAYVIMPNITVENKDDEDHFRHIIREMREFDFNTSEQVIGNPLIHGIPEEEDLDMLNDIDRNRNIVGQIIQEYLIELEDEADAKLSNVKRIKRWGFLKSNVVEVE